MRSPFCLFGFELIENVIKIDNISECDAFVKELKEIGILDDNTKVILNHFSHNGASVLYDDFVKIADEYGFLVSFDGMEIEI